MLFSFAYPRSAGLWLCPRNPSWAAPLNPHVFFHLASRQPKKTCVCFGAFKVTFLGMGTRVRCARCRHSFDAHHSCLMAVLRCDFDTALDLEPVASNSRKKSNQDMAHFEWLDRYWFTSLNTQSALYQKPVFLYPHCEYGLALKPNQAKSPHLKNGVQPLET